MLLRAWPEIRRRTGARLRIAGADPLAVRLLLTRLRVPDDGIDVLGFLSQDDLTAELASAKALVAPSLGGESFGMVLTRAFACATPVVASDITGYRDVMTPETSVAVPPGDPRRSPTAVAALARGRAAARRRSARRRARSRSSATRGTTSPAGSSGSTRPLAGIPRPLGGGVSCPAQPAALQVVLALLLLAARRRLLWWRGPDWNVVYHAFDLVNWAWIVFALGLNLLSVLARSLAWRLTIDQALEPPRPPFNRRLLGLLGRAARNAVLPGPDRRARPRRRAAPAPAARPGHERARSSAPSSRTGSSTSSRRCCWSSTCSRRRRSRTGR